MPPRRFVFLKLLLIRGIPVLFRPAAIAAEGIWLRDEHLLVFAIPLVSMALQISSIPVHQDYYLERKQPNAIGNSAKMYVASLTMVMILSALLLAFGLTAVYHNAIVVTIGVVLFFLSEKYFDELSRWVEFRKMFGAWFFIQLARSLWLMVPIFLNIFGVGYNLAFLCTALLVLFAIQAVFFGIIGFLPRISLKSSSAIRQKWIFILGAILPALYRQGPRLIVVSLFPSISHAFVSVAQLVQSTALLLDLKVQIPYRRLSARRPKLFYKIWRGFLRRIEISCIIIGLIYISAFSFLNFDGLSSLELSLMLLPIFVVEILGLSSLRLTLGLVPWFVKPCQLPLTYVSCLSIYLFAGLIYFFSNIHPPGLIVVLLLPLFNAFIGMIWGHIIELRHFKK
jgi:hypothetical protein